MRGGTYMNSTIGCDFPSSRERPGKPYKVLSSLLAPLHKAAYWDVWYTEQKWGNLSCGLLYNGSLLHEALLFLAKLEGHTPLDYFGELVVGWTTGSMDSL
jgi:hypothetical protein